jgi:predicted metal-dependent phosphoesterase TrpH
MIWKEKLGIKSMLVILLSVFIGLMSANTLASVSVTVGPTDIPLGNAVGQQDITIRNNYLAIAIAVESAPPWGVARGGIIDVAEVRNGKIGNDHASLVDLIPNNWSSWPTTYQKVSIEQDSPRQVIVKTVRDWGEVVLETTYSLKAGENKVHILTEMTNKGDKTLNDLLSGYVLWPDGGYLFGVPGMLGANSGKTDQAIAHWTAAYDQDWSIGMHAPYATEINYSGKDLYLRHDLAPEQSRIFEGWLHVSANGDLRGMINSEIELNSLASGNISGQVVTSAGKSVNVPAIVILKDGQPYSWVLGNKGYYSLDLPVGQYQLYATARQHSQSKPVDINVTSNSKLTLDFNTLQPPGELEFQVVAVDNGEPLDARITIEQGSKPLIKYFGKKTFFTLLKPIGQAKFKVAPGDYQFKIAAGEGFKARAQLLDITVKPSTRQQVKTLIKVLVRPEKDSWYSADMHHHANVLDGSTSPDYVLRSQLAAGLDLSFLSDHDSSVNHREMAKLSASRDVPFIASMEISPSWAHFNAYPLNLSQPLMIDSGTATVDEVFKAARNMGAQVIQANHPLIPYGYLSSLDKNKIPGGFNPNFDLLEINAHVDHLKTVERVWQRWNHGKKEYFSAGSDTHDVWKNLSGLVRVYAHLDGKVTPDRFVEQLKQGHSYVTFGPLIFPKQMFGEEIHVIKGEKLELSFDIQAVDGLKSVRLIERGNSISLQKFDHSITLTPVNFTIKPTQDTWYSLVVEDSMGKKAFSNPVWVKTQTNSIFDME